MDAIVGGFVTISLKMLVDLSNLITVHDSTGEIPEHQRITPAYIGCILLQSTHRNRYYCN
jgi:hypothetical protein